MSDVFEPVREEIRHLQAQLRGEEDYYTEAQQALMIRVKSGEMNTTEYSVWMENLQMRIRQIEWRIEKLMHRIPPLAVAREGYVELLPIVEEWQTPNPRALV